MTESRKLRRAGGLQCAGTQDYKMRPAVRAEYYPFAVYRNSHRPFHSLDSLDFPLGISYKTLTAVMMEYPCSTRGKVNLPTYTISARRGQEKLTISFILFLPGHSREGRPREQKVPVSFRWLRRRLWRARGVICTTAQVGRLGISGDHLKVAVRTAVLLPVCRYRVGFALYDIKARGPRCEADGLANGSSCL